MSDTEKLREQNDAFKKTFVGGVIKFDRELQHWERSELQQITRCIQRYNKWPTDNGYRSAHDFGHIRYRGSHLFWAIHYQDASDIGKPSIDPTDPTKTQRLLMVVHIDWYDDGGYDDDDEGSGGKRYKPEQEKLPR
jgi:Protein of unknown function (DUF3768)